MTEQIQSHPTNFTVEKHFGPFFASCKLPQDALDAMLKMSDDILSNKLSESHGQSLAGHRQRGKSLQVRYGKGWCRSTN